VPGCASIRPGAAAGYRGPGLVQVSITAIIPSALGAHAAGPSGHFGGRAVFRAGIHRSSTYTNPGALGW